MSGFIRLLPAVLAGMVLFPGEASAQAYPSRPIRFVVGYAAGGGTDSMARAVATKLPEILKQQVIVENRPGANANLAAEYVARQPADGYTVLFISVSHAMSKSVYSNLGYDIERDYVPLTLVGEVPNLLAVHPSLPVRTVQDLVKLAKVRSEPVTFAVAGSGSPGHFAGEMLNMAAKTNLAAIPYKGGGPLASDLLAGHVMATFNAMPPLLPIVRSQRVRAVAVSTSKRSGALPDVPTVSESGVPGYAVSTWYGCVVRTGTPADVIAKLHDAVIKSLADARVKEVLLNHGATVLGGSSQDVSAFIREEVSKYSKIAATARIRVD